MKEIGVGISCFNEIIERKYLYVDKTEFIWKLLQENMGEYFLIRPHGFGKSLLISTLKAAFLGQRGLFKGLAIDKMPYSWKPYPVVHFDFGDCKANTPDKFCRYLDEALQRLATVLGITLHGCNCTLRFADLINKAAGDDKVVVLVDNYDMPFSRNVGSPSVHGIHRLLRDFLLPIKGCNDKIHLALLAGTHKISLADCFGGLNNLTDITLKTDYAGMLGFTETEIREHFADRIPLAAAANGCTEEELMQTLLKWYDGYRFSNAETHVCNPVSLSTFFSNNYEFSNYWGKTGMPSFLLELAKNTRFNFELALSQPVSDLVFGAYELDNLDPMGLLWQTGYLTIKELVPSPLGNGVFYRLGFPDLEVEQSFNTQLLTYYSGFRDMEMSAVLTRLMSSIRENRIGDFMKTLQSYFASIPYDIHGGDERYYQTIFFITFLLLGTAVEAESRTSDGRIDALIATMDHVFIFEFKLDKPAPTALEQIEDKEYYLKYRSSGKAITLIGASFDQSRGKLAEWKLLDL
jgi:hypothetical protein